MTGPSEWLRAAEVAPLECQRDEFSLPQGMVYLNCAYMGPLPNSVRDAGARALAARASPAGIGAEAFFEPAERARRGCAALVNADPERTALVTSTAQAVALAIRNLAIAPGRTVVVPGEQFPSNVLGWRRLARTGVELKTVPRPEDDAALAAGLSVAGLWNRRLVEAIDERCAAVAIEPGHWTDGARFDLEALGARARAVGAAVIVDATQFVGAMALDVARLQPDLLVAHAYKSMLSHYGLGFAVFGPRFAEDDAMVPLDEHWMVRRDAEIFTQLVDYQDAFAPGMRRFDTNVRASTVLVESLAEATRRLQDWRPERVEARCRRVSKAFDAAARGLGYGAAEPADRTANLFGLRAPAGTDLEALRQRLRSENIYVSIRGESLRVSLHVYNDDGDLETLVRALAA
ncbi:MAG: aminotransferase class V-fold PLP-dependent enzyme [Burkholderiaceae bacterium]